MNRRSFLTTTALLPFVPPAISAVPDWQARLITSASPNAVAPLALHITLAKGWKTYWRVPGEAGIPPQIKLTGEGITNTEILYPLPQRLVDDSGEALGYHDEVVFFLKPRFAAGVNPANLQGTVKAFFGVCQMICKPARFEADVGSAVTDAATFAAFAQRLPVAANLVTAATQTAENLELALTQKVDDIFIDGVDGLYFRKPEFAGTAARLKIDGLSEGQSLKGQQLRIVAAAGGKGLEQVVAVT